MAYSNKITQKNFFVLIYNSKVSSVKDDPPDKKMSGLSSPFWKLCSKYKTISNKKNAIYYFHFSAIPTTSFKIILFCLNVE